MQDTEDRRNGENEGDEADMDNQVSCECGYSVRDADEQRVVEQTLQHVRSDHPDLVATVTPDVVRGWIELVP
jgi:predicted small metal-binding protein